MSALPVNFVVDSSMLAWHSHFDCLKESFPLAFAHFEET
jgi:hypothetical protein